MGSVYPSGGTDGSSSAAVINGVFAVKHDTSAGLLHLGDPGCTPGGETADFVAVSLAFFRLDTS